MTKRKTAAMKNLHSNKGFSLVEIIISIAILAAVAVVILDMYVVANAANKRAQDTDIALNMAISAVESFKAGNHIGIIADGGFSKTYLPYGDEYKHYFNSKWEVCGEQASRYEMEAYTTSEFTESGEIRTLLVRITDLEGTEAHRILAELTGKKYYPDNTSAGGVQ